MAKTSAQNKLNKIEMELEGVKRLTNTRPDFDVDEKNWAKTKRSVKNARKRQYKKVYGRT
jgi:hypothetical protein